MKSSKIYRLILITFFILSIPALCFSQSLPLKTVLLNIKALSDSSTKTYAPEKLYLQFDKPYYAIGDTIWLKAYLFNAAYFTASDKSGIMNIDIANDSNKVIKQYKLPVAGGLSWGNITLNDNDFSPGTYTLRAYTNWMRNLGVDCFFSKRFYVAGTGENNWLVNKQVKEVTGSGDTANVKLLLSDINKVPAANKTLQLQVMAGSKHLYKQTILTDQNGLLNVNFKVPEKSANLAIVAESIPAGKKAVITINLNRPEHTDIQFLPEGGNLVAGLPAHIAFKAIGEDGKGVYISGIVTDHNQQQVAVFKSLHNGMGSFDLAVQDGESYKAKVTLPGGLVKGYPLPVIKTTGMVLRVKNPVEGDSLEVVVAAANDVAKSGGNYFLIGKARGIVCYAAIFNFNDGAFIKRKIAKRLFPTGIAHFTVMTADERPINERLIFIDHYDNLNIQLTTDKPDYNSRDSIALKIKVTDNTGNPVAGSFSLAVTDDAQVKKDVLNDETILTRILLTSDLKGYVEQPGYYLSLKTSETWQALDNLLLTQGWVGYDWGQVFSSPAITYQPEHELTVKGNVVNVFNKPVKGTNVLLFSKTPSILMDTTTNAIGEFIFDRFPKVDTPVFVLKAVNKNGKSFNVLINVDEVKPPEFTKENNRSLEPWYVNSDSTLINYAKSNTVLMQQDYVKGGGHLLKEVKITAKKIVPGSQNLNGPGEADIILDEKDLEKAGKKNFLQLLEENVKGFREMVIPFASGPMDSIMWYYLHDKKAVLVIDGILLNDVYQPLGFLTLKNYLESHDAEDIKGIEVMSSDVKSMNYVNRFGYSPLAQDHADRFKPADAFWYVFIEITTRSGHGPIIDNTPGMYLYKPLAISTPKQFYKPKYTLNDTTKHLPDLRSTIDWEPNITTDKEGEATVFFYAADKPSTYTITIEGADMNGALGYKLGRIVVKGK